MTVMARYPDKYFDLGIVDPVYGIDGNSHRKNKSRGKATKATDYHNALWSQERTNGEYFTLLFQKTKDQIIFGGNYFPELGPVFKTPRRTEIVEWIKDNPFGWVVWDKCNGTTSFNDYELIWTSFKRPTIVYKFMWNGMLQGTGIYSGSVMQGKKSLNEKRIHPTQKPIPLYKWILINYASPEMKIIDTHLGSGSNAISCYDFKINEFISCEIETKYYAQTLKRYKDYIAQISLF